VATDVVATCRGRVVKTVGDEVLFVADAAPDCVEIALQLVERLAAAPSLPELRIGLAVGEVVTRFGDVYGEAVNIAARLTAHARPDRILVDRNLAAALEHDPRFRLHSRRPLAVRGYRHLQQWELTRADSDSSS
jgi:adenylate cyclase